MQQGYQSLADDFLKDLEELEDTVVEKLNDYVVVQGKERSDVLQDQEVHNMMNQIDNFQLDQVESVLKRVEEDIQGLYLQLVEVYSKKLQDLDNFVTSPVDYAKIVLRLGNCTDIRSVKLDDIISNNVIIAITVNTASHRINILEEQLLQRSMRISQEIIELENIKQQLEDYLVIQFNQKAPNLCKLLGKKVATKLIIQAGGIKELALMPSCNIQVLGINKQLLTGFSTLGSTNNLGIISQTSICKNLPQKTMQKAIRWIACKCSLAIKCDLYQKQTDSQQGRKWKQELKQKVQKELEPPLLTNQKPLQVPQEKSKNKRGGRKVRAAKRRFELSQLAIQRKRIKFGEEQQEDYVDYNIGMIQSSGNLAYKDKHNRKLKTKRKETSKSIYAIDSQNGIQTVNQNTTANEENKYFSSKTGFSTVLSNRLN